MWQDYVIAGVIVVFQLTLLPIIWAKIQLPWLTIIPMLIGSMILIVCYYSLDLIFSTLIEIISAILWSYILFIRTTQQDSEKFAAN